MVDVSDKAATQRTARAEGFVAMAPATLALVETGEAKKGDVLATARIAGIMAAKRTHELIPLCHPLAITKATVDSQPRRDPAGIRVTAEVKVSGQTGVEMEALTAVVGRLPHPLRHAEGRRQRHALDGIRLIEKTGGRSGDYRAADQGKRVSAMAALLPSTRRWRRILDGVAPTPARDRRPLDARAPAHAGRAARRAADAAAVRRLRHGRLRGARRRRRDTRPRRSPSSARRPPAIPSPAASAAGEAVRIFTGAPLPDGADAVVIQEDTAARRRQRHRARGPLDTGPRPPARQRFPRRATLLAAGRRLGPRECARRRHGPRARSPCAAAARRHPRDRRRAGARRAAARPRPDRLLEHLGRRRARAEAGGCRRRLLGIARDTREDLDANLAEAPGRRHAGHHRRRLGRRPRPRRPGAGSPRHDARLLEDRHAARQAADVRPPRPSARARPAGQSRLLAGLHAACSWCR